MTASLRRLSMLLALVAIIAGCSSRPAPVAPAPAAPVVAAPAPGVSAAPRSAPVLAPTYPTLGGPVVQSGTASVPLVQGS